MEQKLRRDLNMGNNLRWLLYNAGFSQETLSAELQRRDCDISRSTYQKYESGNLNIPIRVIITLKEIYGCTYDDFFKDLIK